MSEVFYRCIPVFDRIEFREFIVVKKNPKSKWVQAHLNGKPLGDKHIIYNHSTKKYAYASKIAALCNLINRKRAQITRLNILFGYAKESLDVAKKLMTEMQEKQQKQGGGVSYETETYV